MTEKTDHMTIRRAVCAPDTAVGGAVVAWVSALTSIPMNKDVVEACFALWRGACFADCDAEMGTSVRMAISGEMV